MLRILMDKIQLRQVSAGGGHTCYLFNIVDNLKLDCEGLNADGQINIPDTYKFVQSQIVDNIKRKMEDIEKIKREGGNILDNFWHISDFL